MAKDKSNSSISELYQLFQELAAGLSNADNQSVSSDDYRQRLISEISTVRLSRNSPLPDTAVPEKSWSKIFSNSVKWKSNSMRQALQNLGCFNCWLRADGFYPEPEHRHFSENVWGAVLAGQEDAMFHTQDRFIALLILIDPHTTYPLHAHRIEELYYILAGQADWSHDAEQWLNLSAGSIFHNTSYQPHTIRTGEAPLLTLGLYLPPFGWEGGLIKTNARTDQTGQ